MRLASGTVIDLRYRLVRQIAVGGMGEVWEGLDTRLGRSVAVKVLKAELSHDPEFLQRFRIEARTTASINHSGIAAVHDYGEAEAGGMRIAYLVMELVEGEPLSARLSSAKRLSALQTLDVLEQAGRALQAAHERGFVHRDVKPGNILLRPDGRVKLTDFGIAKAANAVPMTRGGMVMGTAQYIAPEQAMGGEASPTGDVYSLGIVGYECLAGRRPFNAENPVDVAMMQIRDTPPTLPSTVPAGVRALVEAALVKDPQLRYASGGEFADAAAAVRAGRQLPPPKGKPPLPIGLQRAAPASEGAGTRSGSRRTRSRRVSALASDLPAAGGRADSRAVARSSNRGRGVLFMLFALLTVAAIVVGAIVVLSALGRVNSVPPAASAAPATVAVPESAAADTVVVTPSAYTGRSASTVVTELRGMGLRTSLVTTRSRTPADAATCRVVSLSPTGSLRRGSVVTVSCEENAR